VGILLSAEDEMIVRDHIQIAESGTTGEIRIYVEARCKVEIAERAAFLFEKHRMFNTLQRNGVLIYIAVESKVFYVYGDEGIHRLAGHEIWDRVVSDIAASFSQGLFVNGLCNAIDHIGEQLKVLFPAGNNKNENELPDDILYADEDFETNT